MLVILIWLVILAILVLLALAKKMLPYSAILAISFGCGIVLQFIVIPIVASLLTSYVCYRNDLWFILSVLMLTTIFALCGLRMIFLR